MSSATTPFEVRSSYLMWIGAEHYGTIEDYAGEAVKYGVSKRLSNVHMASALKEKGTVIFLAHDEHCYVECEECTGTVECGECRKRGVEMTKIAAETKALRAELVDEKAKESTISGTEEFDLEKKIKRLERLIGNRIKKFSKLEDGCDDCDVCEGEGDFEGGTGGMASVSGKEMDYRCYNYWLHQPAKFSTKGKKIVLEMCDACGGTGRLPEGKVFGCILPSDVEYILKEDDDATVAKAAEEAGFKTVTWEEAKKEDARGCGKRKPGGYYVRSSTEKITEAATDMVEKLIAAGLVDPDGVDVVGTFIRFVNPISIPGVKRFRGLKRWSLMPEAEDEVEMAVEALEEAA